jgi:hypothetical protein
MFVAMPVPQVTACFDGRSVAYCAALVLLRGAHGPHRHLETRTTLDIGRACKRRQSDGKSADGNHARCAKKLHVHDHVPARGATQRQAMSC